MSKSKKPRLFGVVNELASVQFHFDSDESVLIISGYGLRSEPQWSSLSIEAKTARWLGEQLLKAAEYMEKQAEKRKAS